MKVAAIILAAGGSSRLGQPKQLVRLGGQTLIRRAARAALGSNCAPVFVIVGAEPESIEQQLAGLNVAAVRNEQWREGIGSSIRIGVEHVVATDADHTILLACDQPEVDAAVLNEIKQLRLTSGKPIVASAYAQTLGIPALFDRAHFDGLSRLKDDHGAKGIILADREVVAEFPFAAGAIDIDTPADYERLINLSS